MFDYLIELHDGEIMRIQNVDVNVGALFREGYAEFREKNGTTTYLNVRYIKRIEEKRVDRDA